MKTTHAVLAVLGLTMSLIALLVLVQPGNPPHFTAYATAAIILGVMAAAWAIGAGYLDPKERVSMTDERLREMER